MTLVVHDGDGKVHSGRNPKLNLESHSVMQNEFGEYVASLHSHQNSTFILQYQVISLVVHLLKRVKN